MSKILKISLFLLIAISTSINADSRFPRPQALEADVQFWINVYTKVGTNGGYIHDAEKLEVVYKKINTDGLKGRARSRFIKREKKEIEKILKKLARGARSNLSAEEQRILDLWPQGVSNRTLKRATKNIRFQLGQANKFKAGFIRAGAWMSYIRNILKEKDAPLQLSALPHVESSFNPYAYSKVGAAGLWQFTRSTGRRFMRVDHVIDERMDPYRATVAAAQLLKYNHSHTDSWPLALTAYNHGLAGMRRAIRILGTRDITTVVRNYKSRSFGFASRNFYLAFLAALEIETHNEKYFGKLERQEPVHLKLVRVPDYITAKSLQKALGISQKTLQMSNPALRGPIWSGNKYIPKDYQLVVNWGADPKTVKRAIAKIDQDARFNRQKRDVVYRVRRGDTLSTIARRYRVRIRDLRALNGLRGSRIYVGQRIRLPQRGQMILAKAKLAEQQKPPVTESKVKETEVKQAEVSSEAKQTKVTNEQNVAYETYKVKRGDSVYSIAKRYNISQRRLLALNNLRRRSKIYPGQKLRIKPQAEQETVAQKIEAQESETPKTDSKKPVVLAKQDDVKVKSDVASGTQEPALNDLPIAKLNTDFEQWMNELESVKQPEASTEEVEEGLSEKEKTEAKEKAIESPKAIAKIDKNNIVDEGQPVEPQPELSADPSDYEVHKNNTIDVQASETLGHYAEWLNIRASQLRRINRLRYGRPVHIGKRIKLDFSKVSKEDFEKKRIAYHEELQEQFFANYQITGTTQYKTRRGDSLWKLTKRKYKIPVWLLRQYNPDIDFDNIKPGTKLSIPKLEVKELPDVSLKDSEKKTVKN